MNRQPFVSVIMIFHNAAPFIQEAIESVVAQTYANWELVLVDDGSTDDSTTIALRYAEQYPTKVRYFHHGQHQNRGMSASRNLGLKEANGEYIAFLDADDVYLPRKLEQQVSILADQPLAAMVYGATVHWFSWTGRPEDFGRDRPRLLGVPPQTLVHPPQLVQLFLKHEAWPPGTCGVLVRRTVIEEIGGFEEQFGGMFEDQVFFYKLCLKYPVFVENGSWDRYRQHPNSHSQVVSKTAEWRRSRRVNRSRQKFLEWFSRYLSEQQVTDPSVLRLLRKELWPFQHPILYRFSEVVGRGKQGLLKRIARFR